MVGLPKTTAFKYLYTLEEAGFVTHSEDKDRYQIGTRVWELGQLAGAERRLREVSLPEMIKLRDSFNETVNLGILDRREVLYLEMVESRHALSMRARVGGRDPVYSTSLGKAMLAFVPEEQWPDHLPTRLVRRAEGTHTSLKTLKRELLTTRERGYALDRGENEPDARCVGAPIFGQSGEVAAAISVSAPASRLTQEREAEVGNEVMRAAASISRSLGYASTAPDGQGNRDYSLR